MSSQSLCLSFMTSDPVICEVSGGWLSVFSVLRGRSPNLGQCLAGLGKGSESDYGPTDLTRLVVKCT